MDLDRLRQSLVDVFEEMSTMDGIEETPERAADIAIAAVQVELDKGPTQADVLKWVEERWPSEVDPMWRALKLGEEAGEVQGAVIKMREGRESLSDLAIETAQLVLCAMALAESAGFDLLRETVAEWERRQTRGWHISRGIHPWPLNVSPPKPVEITDEMAKQIIQDDMRAFLGSEEGKTG